MSNAPAVRTAIAGLGRSGWNIHAPLLADQPERFSIVAVQDVLPERRTEAEERFGCRSYAEFSDLIGDPELELVVIAVPSPLHSSYAVSALQAGLHVLGEKPMATSLQEAETMVSARDESGKLLSIFQSWRFFPEMQKVLSIVRSGVLGKILQARLTAHNFARRWDWQTLQHLGGGSLNNWGAHLIDAALTLFGPSDPRVLYVSDCVQSLGDAEDHLKIVLTRDPENPASVQAPTLDIEISSSCAYAQQTFHIMGSTGGLIGSTKDQELHWRHILPGSGTERILSVDPPADRSYPREDTEWIDHHWTRAEAKAAGSPEMEGQARFYREFFDAIRYEKPLPVTTDEVMRQMRIMEECRRQSMLA